MRVVCALATDCFDICRCWHADTAIDREMFFFLFILCFLWFSSHLMTQYFTSGKFSSQQWTHHLSQLPFMFLSVSHSLFVVVTVCMMGYDSINAHNSNYYWLALHVTRKWSKYNHFSCILQANRKSSFHSSFFILSLNIFSSNNSCERDGWYKQNVVATTM